MRSIQFWPLSVVTAACVWSSSARALEPIAERPAESVAPTDGARSALDEAPVLAFTHSAALPSAALPSAALPSAALPSAASPTAFGVGASAFGIGTFALSGDVQDETRLGGGIRVWGSPFQRCLLLAEAVRRDNGKVAPSLALQVRFWEDERWAFGALGRFKSEGFAEIEGEIEAGLLGSYDAGALHLDLNAIVGRGFDEAETDGELALRAGQDLFGASGAGFVRAGFEGRVRYRLAGDLALPGGRSWDVVAGPQLSASFNHFFASLLTGPSTVGVVSGVGWESLATFGGAL